MVALLVAGVATVYWATFRPGHDWGGDFSQYITHARNVALGRPYRETRYVVTLAEAAIHMPAAYPPTFPLLLAPIYWEFGLNLTALKVVPEAMFALATGALYVFARLRGLHAAVAVTAAAAFGLSGLVLSLKDLILSDSTHLFFALATLCALLVVEREHWDERRPLSAAAGVAALMVVAYSSRSIGLALVAAFAIHQTIRRRHARVFTVATLGLVAIAVLALTATVYDSRVYKEHFPVLPVSYAHHVVFYLKSAVSLWAGSPPPFRYTLACTTSVMAAIGWWRRVTRSGTVAEVYVAIVVLVAVAYSLGYNERYILPVLALYFVYVLECASFAPAFLRWASWIPAATCALLATGVALNVRGMNRAPYAQGVEQTTFQDACAFIRQWIDRDALIVSWNPRVIALYTDRRSAWYPDADDAAFDRYLDTIGAEYVLVYLASEQDTRSLVPHIIDEPGRFVRVFVNDDFTLYRVNGAHRRRG